VTDMDDLIVFINTHICAAKSELKKLEEYEPTCTANDTKIMVVTATIDAYKHILEFMGEKS